MKILFKTEKSGNDKSGKNERKMNTQRLKNLDPSKIQNTSEQSKITFTTMFGNTHRNTVVVDNTAVRNIVNVMTMRRMRAAWFGMNEK